MAGPIKLDWEKVAEGFLGEAFVLSRSLKKSLRKEFVDNVNGPYQEEAGKGFDKVWNRLWRKRKVQVYWMGDQLWIARDDHRGEYDAMMVEFEEIHRLVEDWMGKEEK